MLLNHVTIQLDRPIPDCDSTSRGCDNAGPEAVTRMCVCVRANSRYALTRSSVGVYVTQTASSSGYQPGVSGGTREARWRHDQSSFDRREHVSRCLTHVVRSTPENFALETRVRGGPAVAFHLHIDPRGLTGDLRAKRK